LISLAAIIFGWLCWQDLTPSGVLTAENDFQKKSPQMSDLRPAVRVDPPASDAEGNHFQNVFIDPVYFDVQIPRLFRDAKVTIEYKNPDNHPFIQLGLKKNEGDWNYVFKLIERRGENIFNYRQGEGGWRTAEVVFGLDDSVMDKRTLHFMLSTPELDWDGHEIQIRKIAVLLERDPLTWENFWPRLKRLLGKI